MRRRDFIYAAVSIPFVTTATTAIAKASTPTIVAHGGGTLSWSFARQLRGLAGGRDAQILLAPYSAKNPSKRAAEELAKLKGLGFRNIEILNLSSFQAARSQIRNADMLWFAGGSQRRQAETLQSVPGVQTELREAHSNGVIMAGSSAGAAVMSRVMITGGKKGNVKTQPGLGFWENVVLDQLVDARKRKYRLREVISANRRLLGLGLDEGTWVEYSNGIATVGGRGVARLVYWSDGIKEIERGKGAQFKLSG
ncbi:MAG: cyanophycinase [Paracoccaceae bacterium]